jgi:NAD(P)-dependent dehydrogenase (short-subunit alcohol dehydrogenase family)
MAYDYGAHNIRVNTLCPGWVRTPMSEHEMDFLASQKGISRAEAFSLVTAHLPLRRAAEPEEIANCCLFLASDEASFVTGTVLVADGGGAIVDVGTLAFLETG